jgi:hypothetical protein
MAIGVRRVTILAAADLTSGKKATLPRARDIPAIFEVRAGIGPLDNLDGVDD